MRSKEEIEAATRSSLAQRGLIEIDEMLKSNVTAEEDDRWWRLEDFAEPVKADQTLQP